MKKCLLILLFVVTNCFSQFSKTHYIPPLSASDFIQPEDQYLYISTPNTNPVYFRIINLGGSVVEGTVSRDNPYIYYVGFGGDTQLMTNRFEVNSILPYKGFVVEADDLIYVTARIIAGGGNQAGEIVSKGLAALGTNFRIGALLNTLIGDYSNVHYTFVAILATENNTTVTFSDIFAPVSLINNSAEGNTPAPIILNSGESFVMAVEGPLDANRDGLVGSLVSSDKPIAVNCGSFGGTNGAMNNIDTGFDQIVSAERTGKDYIFIRGTGLTDVERVLIIAHENGTQIFRDGNPTPVATLSAGEYLTFNGADYDPNGNLYISSSKNVFAYQSIGDDGRPDQANQELFFVPPLSCETPRIIDNIPDLNEIGDRLFNGRVTIITQTGSSLDFVINGTSYPLSGLPADVTVNGPNNVTGNAGYQTYVITGLSGDVSVISSGQLYLASYGSSDAATFGGFYSGFTFKPEIAFDKIDIEESTCIPNVTLSVSPITAFDVFQWYFNDAPIAGATSRDYIPTVPGYYHVSATISSCGTNLISDKIPVSSCPEDSDNDQSNDNVDFDFDNDGITNCNESNGNIGIDISNPLSGNITGPGYTNAFTGNFPPGNGPQSPTPFVGAANGNFVTEVLPGKGNSISYNMAFDQPVSISMEYATTGGAGDWINSNSEFIISVPSNKTISVLNPDNQLLIDTNYDGIYESGVTEFSSFEIRFRLNTPDPLPVGTGTFSFRSYLAGSFTYTHKNLSDLDTGRATFNIAALCLPNDSDLDGIPDQQDFDSDNDGIPDRYESQGISFEELSGIDTNEDGIDDIFGNGMMADSDADGVPNHLDLDSDNDGIYDLFESFSSAADMDNNGIIDGNASSFGNNGLSNSVETTADSGDISYTLSDVDTDGIFNYVDSDTDGDGCNDVLEASFSDSDGDGQIGNNAPVSTTGIVLGFGGYIAPGANYLTPTPIIIETQPVDNIGCESRAVSFTIDTNDGVTYQWQVSADGVNFSNLPNNALYSGVTTSTLTIANVTAAMDGNSYRVLLDRSGNVCGKISANAILTVYPLPPSSVQTLIQCEIGATPDGITLFNLEEAIPSLIGSDTSLEIAFFESVADAENSNNELPLAYTNLSNPQQLTVRLTNPVTGCFSLSTLNLSVNLLPNIVINLPEQCDDDGSENGFYLFDLTDANIPASNIRYYVTENDALMEINEINNAAFFQNSTPYTAQTIFVRAESGNDCSRIYLINIKVNPLPAIDANLGLEPHVVCVNAPTFTTVIDAGLEPGVSGSDYQYQWSFNGDEIPGANSPTLTVDTEGTYTVKVTDANGCTKIRTIPVIASSTAIIENITVTDMAEFNTVTVTITSNSYGDYVYSLDFQNAFQQSNVFANVPAGIHTVYVKDLNGCPVASQVISVLGIPPFFTPNGDGFNDTWNVKGVNGQFHPGTTVHIFDRYGKLLKMIGAQGTGWDGTYNGQRLPSDDYWFVVTFEDGKVYKGHFALKR